MKTKIQYYKALIYDYVYRLRDIRVAGQLVFVVIVLLISWSGVKAIQANYGLQKQIATLKQQNAVQELENNNLRLENEYYNTDQYLELSARQNFGLADPGEKEILVPQSVALNYAPAVAIPTQPTPTISKQPGYQRNIQAWVNFFLHRHVDTN